MICQLVLNVNYYSMQMIVHFWYPDLTPNSIATQLSQELKSCYDWLVDNKFSLHLGKTESILFSTKRKSNLNNNFQVFFNTTPITNVNSVKYLGLNLDSTLSGESIVSTITQKATSRLKFLYRYNSILKEQSKKSYALHSFSLILIIAALPGILV